MHDPRLDEYDRLAPALATHVVQLRDRLTGALAAEAGLKLHSVTARVKQRASVAGKLARPERTYGALCDLTDLIGLRVITYFEDGVEQAGRIVEAALPVDFERSVDKRRPVAHDRFGYRSLHYVCSCDSDSGLPAALRYEIQVRTVLEHAWAEIEHDLGYKTRDSLPSDARRRLNRLAGLLELADQEFAAIRHDLSAYAQALPARIAAADEIALDRLSLASLLDCPEVRELDAAIARQIGRAVGDEPFYPDYLLRMLAASRLTTVSATRRALVSHHATILGMIQPYFRFASAAWRLSPDQLDRVARGYSLLFLVHAVALDAPSLGIDKVARLAHLYHQVDYPDDRAAALRVASELLATLDRARIESAAAERAKSGSPRS